MSRDQDVEKDTATLLILYVTQAADEGHSSNRRP